MECRYEPRRIRSKRSLQAELNTLKAAQRQKDGVIAALSVPDQSMEVLQRLWMGESIESIYETLGCDKNEGHTTMSQPATNVLSASSSSTPTQALSGPQPAMELTENVTAHREEETPNHEALFQPRTRTPESNAEARFSRSPSITEDNTQTSREQSVYASDLSPTRKCHRTASASDYKKQMDQIEFMRAVKLDIEIRNQELKKERAELWHQMMAAKSALMGHADCNHPTINAYVT
ncbi:hypothetical protein CCUS01_13716 [Colletotrichum cuscutae]|uniref:Uncharacterized protein n=1 Tax=Colletotrichum cuscutae TaxID=1209917 RepID=A0AAI9YB81_9PEZI|nr:hypothetical protein CCUS01_13716 [Colletotrichum cuscutae]